MFTTNKIDSLLASYPRTRPPLTPEHEILYVQEYKENREGNRTADGLAQKLEKWMHFQVARRRSSSILELGAGTLNHVEYEKSTETYDIVEPFSQLYQNSHNLFL